MGVVTGRGMGENEGSKGCVTGQISPFNLAQPSGPLGLVLVCGFFVCLPAPTSWPSSAFLPTRVLICLPHLENKEARPTLTRVADRQGKSPSPTK